VYAKSILILFVVLLNCVPTAWAEAPSTRPYILHLPGVAGLRGLDRGMGRGLQNGADAEVEFYDWTCGEWGVAALHAFERNKTQSEEIARRIITFAKANPDRPITLSGHSGGSGLAVWALENLPDDVHVERLIMLAPALSPGYDLSRALRHVKGKAYAFTSKFDLAVLGAGTRAFGTIDGVHSVASGLIGFSKPPGADEGQYAKLVPVPYQVRWMKYGNIGDHIGPMCGIFARHVLAGLIRGDESVLTEAPAEPSTRAATLPAGENRK